MLAVFPAATTPLSGSTVNGTNDDIPDHTALRILLQVGFTLVLPAFSIGLPLNNALRNAEQVCYVPFLRLSARNI